MAATQTPTTPLAPPKPIQELRQLLERSKDQLAMALPQHMTAERMTRIAITAVQKQPRLLECTALSILGCVIEASQLGLYPDGILGDAYLVPYWNGKNKRMEAQLQPGYRGLINLARRSGQVSAIYSEPVYGVDKFIVELGTEHTIIHVPNYDDPQRGIEKDDLGVPIGLRGVYAVVKFKDGTSDFEYMPLHRIMDIRNNSKSKDKDGDVFGPWVSHFEEMARKTPIRRLAKRLPLSPEFQKAAVLDEYVDAGVAPDFTAAVEINSEAMRLATDNRSTELDAKYATSEASPAAASADPSKGLESEQEIPAPEQLSPEEQKARNDRRKELEQQTETIKSQRTGKHSVNQQPVQGITGEFGEDK